MPEKGSEQLSLPITFRPFLSLPPMTLRLFGVQHVDRTIPWNRGGGDWEPYRRYRLFRRGIGELLRLSEWKQATRISNVTNAIIKPSQFPRLFKIEPGLGLTYYGEVEDTPAARSEVKQVLNSEVRMQVMDVFYEIQLGEVMPESWQKLHDQTARLARKATEE